MAGPRGGLAQGGNHGVVGRGGVHDVSSRCYTATLSTVAYVGGA